MRNLKRALSLALASVMLLGMMVVGTSAASYTDVDDKDNVEAIEVLNAVNVMIGRQGNFEPDEAVNRHEMAVIMAKLVLGVETADNYVGSHPFTDVVPWADKYVAACYENGLVAGTSATTYGGGNPLTAVQAAAMMLRALGYEDLSKGADDWRAPVTAAANRIRLFDGVASNPSERLDRNQVAQLALNTLKSPVVDTKQGLNITGSNGDYTFTINGDREYTARSSSKAFAKAIDATEAKGTSASSIGGCTIELGEQLYNGDLKLYNDRTDVFGRPARRWEYKGEEIGTYAKTELLRAEYTAEVTGRELYDLLGSSTVSDFDVNVTIDGIDASSSNASAAQIFNKTAINRNNKSGVGGTGNGVLTQVYVDPNKGDNGTVDIAIINTYLARATKDYDAKKETLDLDVYGLDKKSNSELVKTITTGSDYEGLKVSSEDFAVEDVKEKDAFLVTVADGGIQTMQYVQPMSAVEITSFQARDLAKAGSGNLTTGGKKYDYSSAAEYDNGVLSTYTDGTTVNLKETTYDVYLDNYDNVIGVKEVSKTDNYVFITGVDSGSNNLATTTLKANAIFLDGTMKEIQIDRNNSKSLVAALAGNHQDNSTFNKWCTYSVSSKDVYSLTLVAVDGPLTAAGQTHTTVKADLGEVNNKHLSVKNANNVLVYGNNKSVYLSASVNEILTISGRTDCIIDGVDSVTTGIDNVDVIPLYGVDARKAAGDTDVPPSLSAATTISEGAYTLYDKNGWIIAMVVIGDDNGKNSELVYVHNASVAQEYYMGSDGYKWERTVIVDGVEKTLTEVNDTRISMLQQMYANNWYRVKTNAKDEVTAVDGSHDLVNRIDNDGKNAGGTTIDNGTGIFDKIGDWGFKLDGTTRTAYATAYSQYVAAVRDSRIDTILYHEAFGNVKQPTVSGQTLYVKGDATTNSGVRFAEDVKVVLDQMNDNKRTTEYYNGESGLKNAIRDLHPATVDANGNALTYNYEISAVIEGPYATSIVIRDNTTDGNSGGALTPGGVAGVKVAIAGADTSASALNIGYFGVAKPDLAGVDQAVRAWAADEKNAKSIVGPIATTLNNYKWTVYDGLVYKDYTLDVSTGVLEGVRVRYTTETGTIAGDGYEILSAAGNTSGSATKAVWAMADTNSDGKNDVVYAKHYHTSAGYYIAAKTAGTSTWTWSDVKATDGSSFAAANLGECVSINGHDYDVFLSTYTLKYRMNKEAWKYTANANLIDASSNEYTATTFEAAYPGKVFGTIAKGAAESTVTYAALGNKAITDGDTYTTGFVAIPKDAGSSDTVSVKVNNTAVTADQGTNWVVPINTDVEIHIAYNAAAKTFRATGATTADITTVASTGGDGTIKTGTANVTFGALTKLTLPASVAGTLPTGLTLNLAWTLNDKAVSGDVYVAAADVLKATVTFATAFDDANTTADEIEGAATNATVGAVLVNTVGTPTAGTNKNTVALVTDEIPANSTIVFTFTGATAAPTITYTAK